MLDDKKILINSEQLLNKEFLRFPYRDNIHILHGFSVSGIYRRIYWMKEDLQLMEEPLWRLRYQNSGIRQDSKVCFFVPTYYIRNTLVNKFDFFHDQNSLYICEDQLLTERIRVVIDKMSQFGIEWVQLSGQAAEMLLAFIQNYPDCNFNPKYIEVLNTGNGQICKHLTDEIGCVARRAYMSELFGLFAYEDDSGNMKLLNENVSCGIFGNKNTLLSTKCNRAMPVVNYNPGNYMRISESNDVILQAERAGAENVLYNQENPIKLSNGITLCTDLLYRPAEFINEKHGKIVNQIQVIQLDSCIFQIKLGINRGYFGWCEEIKKLYRQYLNLTAAASKLRFEFQFQFFQMFLDSGEIIA